MLSRIVVAIRPRSTGARRYLRVALPRVPNDPTSQEPPLVGAVKLDGREATLPCHFLIVHQIEMPHERRSTNCVIDPDTHRVVLQDVHEFVVEPQPKRACRRPG